MAHFAIEMNDGSIAIMETIGDATPEECIAKWPVAQRQKVVSHTAIIKADIPSDRTYRAAWKLGANGKVIEDSVKKAEIDTVIAAAEAKS